MKRVILSLVCALGLLGVSNASAHDYEDGVTEVDHGYNGDVVHYDHHHYYYDECGNPYVVHHDHHYFVPNDNYGYGQQYYNSGYYNTGYGQRFYRHHRRHRAALSFFFGG